MTAYAFVNDDEDEAWEIPTGVGFINPYTGESFPANWATMVSQAEREAKNAWPVVEPSAVVFPDEITSQALVVTTGPIVTRTNTTSVMSFAAQEAFLKALINDTERAKLGTSFPSQGGTEYPITDSQRQNIAILGQIAMSSSLGRRAFGYIDWNANDNPANNATITINGVTFTFKTASPTGNEILIGADSVATVENTVAALNASTDPAVSKATYYLQGFNKLSVYYKHAGALGNAFTLALSSSPACNAVRSGATLTGGWDPIEPGKPNWHRPDDDAFTFEIEDVDGVSHSPDAFQFMNIVRDLGYFTDFVVNYALNQRQAATAAALASDQTALQTVYDDVTNPANWDPGTPPTWP